MKNKNTYWIIGGILLVIIILTVVYALTRKKAAPVTTVPISANNGGNPIGNLIGSLGNLFAPHGGGSLNYTSPQDIIDEQTIAGGGY